MKRPIKSQIALISLSIFLFAGPIAAAKQALPRDAAASVNGRVISEKLLSSLLKNNKEALRIDPKHKGAEEAKTRPKNRRQGNSLSAAELP